jgi:hypothetical protein
MTFIHSSIIAQKLYQYYFFYLQNVIPTSDVFSFRFCLIEEYLDDCLDVHQSINQMGRLVVRVDIYQ